MEIKKEVEIKVEERLKDPKTADARIYVGGLKAKVKSEDLLKRFGRYGDILDMMHNRGYAIIEYTTPEAAKEAIREEHETRLLNKMITVRSAVLKSEIPTPLASPPPVNETYTVNDMRTPIFPVCRTSQCLPTPNEIEIIALTRDVTPYAEKIETDLRNLGYTVDIMFLNRPYTLSDLLTQLQTKRTTLALVIRTEDMENQTVFIQQLENLALSETLPVNVAMQVIEKRHSPRDLPNRVVDHPVTRNYFTGALNFEPLDPFAFMRQTVEGLEVDQMDNIIGYLQNLRNARSVMGNQEPAQ